MLTNFLLLYLVALVLVMLGLGIAFHPFDSAARFLTYLIAIVGINALGALVAGVVHVKLLSKESIWLQPASERAGTLLVNSVVLLWLCGVGFLMFVILKTTESTAGRVGMIVVLVAGAGLGRYLQRRYWPRSWLGYAIGLLAALLVIVAGSVAGVALKS